MLDGLFCVFRVALFLPFRVVSRPRKPPVLGNLPFPVVCRPWSRLPVPGRPAGSGGDLVLDVLENLADLCFDFVAELNVVCEELFDSFTSLGEFAFTVAEP